VVIPTHIYTLTQATTRRNNPILQLIQRELKDQQPLVNLHNATKFPVNPQLDP
jgi:hypothetical protein